MSNSWRCDEPHARAPSPRPPVYTQRTTMRQTPLIEAHRNAGAKLVDFAGWEMPIQYSG
ncbi:hypothetical protein FBQ96_16855, partial [Nitrospirales bacterium NOB]|nr:hypothetical protein [Nitrospirales bacterium NOB]